MPQAPRLRTRRERATNTTAARLARRAGPIHPPILARAARASVAATLLGLGIVAHAEPTPAPTELTSTATDREGLGLTVYNDNLALVRERRRVTLPAGPARLSLREVSAQMRPETALLQAVTGSPLQLVEQNFDFDLLTPKKLLEKYVGREVSVLRTNPATGEERRERATVLATQDGTVLRFADRIETGVPGRLAFDDVPANLRDRPTLSVLLQAGGGAQSLELSYLTAGLSWRADYVASLSADGRQMDLSGWVTLTNRSGTAYPQARLQLVAGTVNRVPEARAADTRMRTLAAPMAAGAPEQESLLDYHLYTFPQPTTIADQQTKQLALLSAGAIPVRREYLLAGNEYVYRQRIGTVGQKLKPAVFVEFDNRGGQLGKPLPAGIVRVYARDRQGAAQFVGEDRIEHTPRHEVVRLRLGEAFDITADRRQTTFRKVADNVFETAFRIEIRNAREEPVTVRVQETLPGDWEMLQETHRSRKLSARVVSWDVDVPADGASVLEYGVRVR